MRAADVRNLLKQEPFEPVRLGLSDGRAVVIRHPDQAVVSERHLYVGLARVERSKPLSTPRSGDVFAPDWLLVGLVQISPAEPANGKRRSEPSRKRGA
ncbi:MAG: hypothetical protein PVI86_07645 [Phycisphaerae bacterium]|jgi:hypothetical protein